MTYKIIEFWEMSPEYHVYVRPDEAAKFEEAMGQFPGSRILSFRPEYLRTEDINWLEELQTLETLIASSQEAIDNKTPEVLENFRFLLNHLATDPWSRSKLDKRTNNLTNFAQDVLASFQASVDCYKSLPERPVVRHGRGQSETWKYKRANIDSQKKSLTPRELRLLIFTYGLTGHKEDSVILAGKEGIVNIKGALGNAEIHLFWLL